QIMTLLQMPLRPPLMSVPKVMCPGSPTPMVSWLKEKSPEDVLWIKLDTKGYKIASSGRQHSLILMDVDKEYSGIYTCIATNRAGQSLCSAQLEVDDTFPDIFTCCLQDLIRNKARNGQNCCLLEEAYAMVSALPQRSENTHHVSMIENYPATLEVLGEPIRQLNNIDVNETVEGDDRTFEIWHEREDSVRKYTLQARTVTIKNSWLRDLRELQQRYSMPAWSESTVSHFYLPVALLMHSFIYSSEETITTVVKNPRMRRHRSPGLTVTGAHRSETSTPEPTATRPRRMLTPRKSTIPTLYVTEPEGAGARTVESKPRWVEVEEVIEYKVNKSPRLSRRRGISPAGSDRAATPSRSKRSPLENLNVNNSNNNLVEQAQEQLKEEISNQTISWEEDEPQIACGSASREPHELSSVLTLAEDTDDQDDQQTVIFEPDDEDSEKLEPVILKQGDRTLNLEDLEDYIPGEGETYGSSSTYHVSDEKPCEISVLQREIGGSQVGQLVLLNVGRPDIVPRQRSSFFGRFKEHLSNSLFPSASPQVSIARPSMERQIPIQMSSAKLEVQPSYCSEVQRVEGRQQSFKTKVSTQTYSYTSVGKPVTLQIKEKPFQSQ
ncbi:hypothetical protein GOODEAATRI_004024, partial [Goodea atripinnis]